MNIKNRKFLTLNYNSGIKPFLCAASSVLSLFGSLQGEGFAMESDLIQDNHSLTLKRKRGVEPFEENKRKNNSNICFSSDKGKIEKINSLITNIYNIDATTFSSTFRDCNFTDEDAPLIARILGVYANLSYQNLHSFTEIDLSSNLLTSVGFTNIFKVLKNFPNLEKIDLCSNSMDDNDGLRLIGLLLSKPSVKVVPIGGNASMSEYMKNAIGKLCQLRQKGQDINIENCYDYIFTDITTQFKLAELDTLRPYIEKKMPLKTNAQTQPRMVQSKANHQTKPNTNEGCVLF